MKVLLAALLLVGGLVYACEYADVNGDGKVDLKDVYAVSILFGKDSSYEKWNPAADINGDGKVDLKDFYAVAKCFGYTY
jgi:Ca2+-binding EF-hand superfamily protein